jgi:2',3'-cyclic-nucleotide 3'-phosphodiesterase
VDNLGISVWLVPPTQESLKLMKIMQNRDQARARASGSRFSYPEFHPHITLASFPSSSGPSVSELRSAILSNQGSISAEFESVVIGSHYFRSVYIAIKYTPSLKALHEHIHTSVGVEPHTPAFPHLSLCYIDDEDAQKGERERFFLELDHDTGERDQGQGQGIKLRCGEKTEDEWIDGFEASEIWITNCDGPVDQWIVLDKVSLIK